jgi:hypothetical protein
MDCNAPGSKRVLESDSGGEVEEPARKRLDFNTAASSALQASQSWETSSPNPANELLWVLVPRSAICVPPKGLHSSSMLHTTVNRETATGSGMQPKFPLNW